VNQGGPKLSPVGHDQVFVDGHGGYPPGCELPANLRPPSSQVDSVNGYLKFAGNLPHSLENFFISGTFPGTKILTAQLRTSLNVFPQEYFHLIFKLGAQPSTFVAYFLPYPDSVDSQINYLQNAVPLMDTVNPGSPETPVYLVENAFYPLPVELTSLTANANKRDVTLNWTTNSENDNQGFDIQRQDANGASENVWVKAGFVSGNGTVNTPVNYSFTDRGLVTGKYIYRLKQIDFNGGVNFHPLQNEITIGIPTSYSISQNYPNPFNPSTKIDFELPYDGKVSILIFDISGREVGKLVNEVMIAGYHTVQFNGSHLSSGMYFYRINAEGIGQSFINTKKLVLVK
jgi:hypothetical protein